MRLGVIGLGRMGGNIARRLMRAGHGCVVFDQFASAVATLVDEGATGESGLEGVVARLEKPRAIWVMLPAGEITEGVIARLGEIMERGDAIIDGGNSFYKDDVRRAQALAERGIIYLDVGVSGGIWGFERGYCMMIGGDAEACAGSIRFSPLSRPAPATFRKPRGGRGAIRAPNGAMSTAAQAAPATSSKWRTMGSNTA